MAKIVFVISVTALLAAVMLLLPWRAWAAPGDVITLWAYCGSSSAHTNIFVSNGRPPVFVCSGNTCMPGQSIKWYCHGLIQMGIWLKNHQIGLPDGSIVTDDCLPILNLQGGQLWSNPLKVPNLPVAL